MRLVRFALSPSIVMLAVIALYVGFRVEPGERGRIFAVLGFAAFAATELVSLGGLLLNGTRSRATIAAHLLNACGALLISYSSLTDNGTIPLVIGSLAFSSGMLLWQRELRAANAARAG